MLASEYKNLTWIEVKEILQKQWLIIPVGAIEQHGPHLPLGVDTFLAYHISWDIAQIINAVVTPTIEYGARSLPNSGGGPTYPGTIHIQGNTLIDKYRQIVSGFIGAGAKRMLILNAHWENEPFLIEAIEKCREDGLLEFSHILLLSWWSIIEAAEMEKIFGGFCGWHVEHAGQAETALMLYYAPELVHLDKLVDYNEHIPAGIYQYPTPVSWVGNQGVLSSTKHVTSEMGRQLAVLVRDKIVRLLGEDQKLNA